MINENRFIQDMSFRHYLDADRLNQSSLKDFITSPVLYNYNKQNPKSDTPSFRIGRAIHAWILERKDFLKLYTIIDDEKIKSLNELREIKNPFFAEFKSKNSNVYKYAVLNNPDKTVLAEHLKEDWITAQEINGEVLNKSLYDQIKTIDLEIKGQNELTAFFSYAGLNCKARFDSLIESTAYDVKSSANPYNFERDIIKFKYWVQVGFYNLAYKEITGSYLKDFFFIAVPNKMPMCDYSIHQMSQEFIEWSTLKVASWVEKFSVEKEFKRRDIIHIIDKPTYLV